MSRPAYMKYRHQIARVGLFKVVSTAALIALGITGCQWTPKNMAKNEEICRECIERAFTAQQLGDLDEARSLLETSLESGPEHAETWWNLAEVSIHQDRYDQATEELNEYIRLQQNDPHGYLRLSQLYYLQSEYDLAQTTLKEAIRRIPNNIEAIMLSARLNRKLASPQEALADYYHVLQISPDHSEATLELSEMLLERQESVRAASILRAIAKTNLSNEDLARTHLNLGIAYGKEGRWDDAVEELSIASSLSDNPSARDLYRLAYAHYRAGTTQQSLQLLIKLVDRQNWDRRSEALYATITGELTDQTEGPSSVSATFVDNFFITPLSEEQSANQIFQAGLSLVEDSSEEVELAPPEWSDRVQATGW